ncbi:MAG: transposase, partial [Candidatus Methanoperedens sp.]|nr:transposase [Candidatus Methanoperedens sp.]
KLKLELSEVDKETLRQTMTLGNKVFNEIARYGFENHTCSKVSIHHETYYDIRSRHPELPCSILQGIRDVACEALKGVDLKNLPESKQYSAIRYNNRVCNINLSRKTVTLASTKGRVKATFPIPEYYRQYLEWELRTSTLGYNRQKDIFYLHVNIRKQSPEPVGDKVLGIDRGIVNIAVTSNNKFFNSKPVKNVRAKYAYLRAKLQGKGTRSAKRLLRKIRRKEERFVTWVNHNISKEIAAMPYDMFAIEDLTSIRVQSRTKGVEFTRKLNNWAFFELEQFLRYKAEAIGKTVVSIDPRYTSQKCSVCGHIYKGNRKGNSFKCVKCGFQIHADLNAARNIADIGKSGIGRLTVTQPYITCDEVEARKGIDAEHSYNAPHFKSAE